MKTKFTAKISSAMFSKVGLPNCEFEKNIVITRQTSPEKIFARSNARTEPISGLKSCNTNTRM